MQSLLAMKEPVESREIIVRSVAAARFLAEPRAHFLVMAFVSRPRTVGDVAKSLNMPQLAAWRLTQRALKLGLLVIVSEQPRRGKPLKLYRAVAAAFVIPDELMLRMPCDLLADELRERIQMENAAHGSSHVIRADSCGEPLLSQMAAEGAGDLPFEAWRILRLDRSQALALQKELGAVFDYYEARQKPNARAWLAHAAMVIRRS